MQHSHLLMQEQMELSSTQVVFFIKTWITKEKDRIFKLHANTSLEELLQHWTIPLVKANQNNQTVFVDEFRTDFHCVRHALTGFVPSLLKDRAKLI